MNTRTPRIAVLLLAVVAGASCRSAAPADAGPPIVQPGAPGASSRVIGVSQAADLSKLQSTPADVQFMQGMIDHHAQAVEMTELLKSRTSSAAMKQLALRIELSQTDEINMMEHWLRARGQRIPDPDAMHRHAGMSMPGMAMPGRSSPLMPGMLTPEEMDRLAAARGVEFDRLFLEGMIKHHGGALTMVKELLATPGAGQEADIFAFASDVDADQRMEIDRMDAMLKELQK